MNMSMRIAPAILFLAAMAFLAGCGLESGDTQVLGANVSGARLEHDQAGEEEIFQIEAGEGKPQSIQVWTDGKVEQGAMQVLLRAPDGTIAWNPGPLGGNFSINETQEMTQSGVYKLLVAWDEPVKATFNLAYVPIGIAQLALTPIILLPGLGMILVALLGLAYALVRRLGLSYFFLGCLAWAITVGLKLGWALLANARVLSALGGRGQALFAPGMVVFYLYVGLLTGVFEVLIVWLALHFRRLGQVPWAKALAFGIGFGAIESFLLGVSSFSSSLAALVSPASLPPAALDSIAKQASLLFGLAPPVERIAAVLVHVFCNVLLFYAVTARRPGAFWLSFIYKTLLDTVAAFAQFWGIGTLRKLWTIEGVVVVFALVAWIGLTQLKRIYPQTPDTTATESSQPP